MTWEKGTEVFVCKCGSKWLGEYYKIPVREKGRFHCKDCGAEVHSWNGGIDWNFERAKE